MKRSIVDIGVLAIAFLFVAGCGDDSYPPVGDAGPAVDAGKDASTLPSVVPTVASASVEAGASTPVSPDAAASASAADSVDASSSSSSDNLEDAATSSSATSAASMSPMDDAATSSSVSLPGDASTPDAGDAGDAGPDGSTGPIIPTATSPGASTAPATSSSPTASASASSGPIPTSSASASVSASSGPIITDDSGTVTPPDAGASSDAGEVPDASTAGDASAPGDASVADSSTADATADGGDASDGSTLTDADGAGGCVVDGDCLAPSNPCLVAMCANNTCMDMPVSAGTPTDNQSPGDCKSEECDGAGNAMPVNDDVDLPVDGNQCTNDACNSGVPENSPKNAGVACNQSGGLLCNGNGQCVQCVSPSDCPGQDTECQSRTCFANTCGFSFTAAGTPVSSQTAGDCQVNECDGAGSAISSDDNADAPVDGNQCTDDVCAAGTPSNPAESAGTLCNQSGGSVCDGASACVECNSNGDCSVGTCVNNVCTE